MKGQIWQDDQRPSGTETEMLTRFEFSALGQYFKSNIRNILVLLLPC